MVCIVELLIVVEVAFTYVHFVMYGLIGLHKYYNDCFVANLIQSSTVK